MTVSDLVEDYFLEYKKQHGNLLPYGTYVKLARKHDVSKQCVHEIGKGLGFVVKARPKRPKTKCNYCKRPYRSRNLNPKRCSRKCLIEWKLYTFNSLLTCEICGTGFLKHNSEIKRSRTNIFTCSRKCMYKTDVHRRSRGTLDHKAKRK